jgi:hypothetical protein
MISASGVTRILGVLAERRSGNPNGIDIRTSAKTTPIKITVKYPGMRLS